MKVNATLSCKSYQGWWVCESVGQFEWGSNGLLLDPNHLWLSCTLHCHNFYGAQVDELMEHSSIKEVLRWKSLNTKILCVHAAGSFPCNFHQNSWGRWSPFELCHVSFKVGYILTSHTPFYYKLTCSELCSGKRHVPSQIFMQIIQDTFYTNTLGL